MTPNPSIVSGEGCTSCYHVQARSGFKALSNSGFLRLTVLSGNKDETGLVFLQLMDLLEVSVQRRFVCVCAHMYGIQPEPAGA